MTGGKPGRRATGTENKGWRLLEDEAHLLPGGFVGDDASRLFQIYKEKIWRRAENLQDDTPAPSFSDSSGSRSGSEMEPSRESDSGVEDCSQILDSRNPACSANVCDA